MERILPILVFVSTIATATLSGCAGLSPTELKDWPTRYRAEVEALTKAYTVAAVGVASGAVSRDAAAKTLTETDRLKAQLELAWLFRPTVDGSAELLKARDEARARLATVLGKP